MEDNDRSNQKSIEETSGNQSKLEAMHPSSSTESVFPADFPSRMFQEHMSINIEESTGGTNYWTPIVEDHLQPNVNEKFNTVEEAIMKYNKYAEAAGFDTRRGTNRKLKDKTIIWKYMLCNKAEVNKGTTGHVNTLDDEDGKSKRRSRILVTGCPAQIRFRYSDEEKNYKVTHFEARHNHPLVEMENHDLLKSNREVTFADMQFMQRAEIANLGSLKARKVKTILEGGYSNINSQSADWKNFKKTRDLIVGPHDGQMIIDKLTTRQKCSPHFSFEYQQDGKKITSMFWADEAAKTNYMEFGDTISFDATFRTNKYRMVFVPFTGIDNHLNSVTFGAGLLSDETVQSYKWLLQAFLKAHGRAPSLVMSDQDPALAQAIEMVFTQSRHRLCMWHIMTKLNTKVGFHILNTTDVRDKLNKLVWNADIDAMEFEDRWAALIKKYNLMDNQWLKQMYGIRQYWISAYFKGVPMSGLMKTTSRSESSNSFFNTFLSDGDSFLAFFSCYETAMEKQRYNQRHTDHEKRQLNPTMMTPTQIEKNASYVYTDEVFKLVQKEIYRGAWKCNVTNTAVDGSSKIFFVQKKTKDPTNNKEFKVLIQKENDDITCACNHFVHFGTLCCHAYKVMIDEDYNRIPEKYVLRRWRKDLIHPRLLLPACWDIDAEFEKEASKGRNTLEDCYQIVRNHPEGVKALNEKLDNIKKDLHEEFGYKSMTLTKKEKILQLLGVKETKKIDVEVPEGIRNKGTGRGKRMQSTLEKEAKKAASSRKCKICKKVGHDSRTCPDKVGKNNS